jgi:hypothetical protein
MDKGLSTQLRLIVGILAIICILQALVIGIALHFGIRGLQSAATLEERTNRMISKEFPEVIQGVTDISTKTAQIRSDMADLKSGMATVGGKMDNVASNVGSVRDGVVGLRSDLSSTIMNRSWLVWGNSLNPYLTLAALMVIALALPLLGLTRRSSSKDREPSALEADYPIAHFQYIQNRLDKLTELLESMVEPNKATPHKADAKKLVEESRELLIEARNKLDKMAATKAGPIEPSPRNNSEVH